MPVSARNILLSKNKELLFCCTHLPISGRGFILSCDKLCDWGIVLLARYLCNVSKDNLQYFSLFWNSNNLATVFLLFLNHQITKNLLQKDEGLFLQEHGASRSAINAGRVLGFSTSPRNVDQYKQQLIHTYPAVLQQHIMTAIKVLFFWKKELKKKEKTKTK